MESGEQIVEAALRVTVPRACNDERPCQVQRQNQSPPVHDSLLEFAPTPDQWD